MTGFTKNETKDNSDASEEEDKIVSELIAESEPLKKNIALNELNFSKEDNVIIIFGGEGSGVSNVLAKVSNNNIFIPPELDMTKANKPQYKIVDSLNVGVSAGIIVSYIKNQLINKEDSNSNTTTEHDLQANFNKL